MVTPTAPRGLLPVRALIICNMAKQTYSDKLKDPRWQRKRLEIMERDWWMCQHCFADDRMLSVHHKYYIHGREPWEYDNDSLITLCDDCHAEWENNKDIIFNFAKALLNKGWTPMNLKSLLDLLRKMPNGGGEVLYILEQQITKFNEVNLF